MKTKTTKLRVTDSAHGRFLVRDGNRERLAGGAPVRDAGFYLGEVLHAETTGKIDPGKVWDGISQVLEKMEPKDRTVIAERMANTYLPVGWKPDASGATRTGDRTTADLARQSTSATNMRDRIDAINEQNRRFWNGNDAA